VNPDYAVFLHVGCLTEPWCVRLNLTRMTDRSIVAEWEHVVDPQNLLPAITQILDAAIDQLTTGLKLSPANAGGELQPPVGPQLPEYFIGLEKTLTIACASEAPDSKSFLYQERAILDSLLHLCVAEPRNAPARLLLLSAFNWESKRRPDIVQEYRTHLERLTRECPLAEPINAMAEKALATIVERCRRSLDGGDRHQLPLNQL